MLPARRAAIIVFMLRFAMSVSVVPGEVFPVTVIWAGTVSPPSRRCKVL
jgi:hypothetical protein